MEWNIGDLARIKPDEAVNSGWAVRWQADNRTLRVTGFFEGREDRPLVAPVSAYLRPEDQRFNRPRSPILRIVEKL